VGFARSGSKGVDFITRLADFLIGSCELFVYLFISELGKRLAFFFLNKIRPLRCASGSLSSPLEGDALQ
jgi:hypothetical protein